MLLGANLPSNLWPEATRAASWLHNISPSQRKRGHALNTLLKAWFTYHFRWYEPTQIQRSTAHLLPQWGGIYAYGCWAYALRKERENNTERRLMKGEPRAHLGYLVGYVASNIYRIWVPALEQVVSTRNVQFNESIFYKSATDEVKNGLLTLEAKGVDLVIPAEEEILDCIHVAPLIPLEDEIESGLNHTSITPSTTNEDEIGNLAPSLGVSVAESMDQGLPSLDYLESSATQIRTLPTPEATPEIPERTALGLPQLSTGERRAEGTEPPIQEARTLGDIGN